MSAQIDERRAALARYAGNVSPFRDAPEVELGPLDVGLELATARAIDRLPRGGRVLVLRAGRGLSHIVGAIGSAGVLAVVAAAVAAWSTGWRPASGIDLALMAGAIVLGGASLAAVLSALDRNVVPASRPGDLVGGQARSVLRRITRIAVVMRRGRVDAGRSGALRRALVAAADPDVARWIPRDVRGRAELLLARALAASAGPGFAHASRREVRTLLVAAVAHLDQPAPAEADLAAMDRVPTRVAIPARYDEDLVETPAIADESRAASRL